MDGWDVIRQRGRERDLQVEGQLGERQVRWVWVSVGSTGWQRVRKVRSEGGAGRG